MHEGCRISLEPPGRRPLTSRNSAAIMTSTQSGRRRGRRGKRRGRAFFHFSRLPISPFSRKSACGPLKRHPLNIKFISKNELAAHLFLQASPHTHTYKKREKPHSQLWVSHPRCCFLPPSPQSSLSDIFLTQGSPSCKQVPSLSLSLPSAPPTHYLQVQSSPVALTDGKKSFLSFLSSPLLPPSPSPLLFGGRLISPNAFSGRERKRRRERKREREQGKRDLYRIAREIYQSSSPPAPRPPSPSPRYRSKEQMVLDGIHEGWKDLKKMGLLFSLFSLCLLYSFLVRWAGGLMRREGGGDAVLQQLCYMVGSGREGNDLPLRAFPCRKSCQDLFRHLFRLIIFRNYLRLSSGTEALSFAFQIKKSRSQSVCVRGDDPHLLFDSTSHSSSQILPLPSI